MRGIIETQQKAPRSEVRQPRDEKLQQREALYEEGCFCGERLTNKFKCPVWKKAFKRVTRGVILSSEGN